MSLNIREIRKLQGFLRETSERREGLSGLVHAMQRRHAINPKSPKPVSTKTLGRIANEYSPEEIYLGRARTALKVYTFLEQNRWTVGDEPIKLSDQIAAFLRTKDTQYTELHLHRLCGRYFMYRRYWLDPDSNRFMRSYVSISYNVAVDLFQIREFQKWPRLGINDSNRGYMFPSGQAVLAILNSPQKNTTKFLSITNLQPFHEEVDTPIRSFSGNGIAASDQPPHTGYGFHCLRITEELNDDEDHFTSQTYSFEEMKESRPQAFEEIIRYERFRGVDFIPRPPEPKP